MKKKLQTLKFNINYNIRAKSKIRMYQQAVKFYSRVIDDFIDLVQKEQNLKDLLTQDQIEQINESLRYKMQDPSKYHKQIISNFFSKSLALTKNDNDQIKVEDDFEHYQRYDVIRNEQQQQQKQQKIVQKVCQENLEIKLQNVNQMKSVEDEEDDDLNQFKKELQEKSNIPKYEQVSEEQHNNSNIADLYEFESNDEDQKFNQQQLAQIKQKTAIHILGSYNTREKKFNPKKQQTKITIYNAFFKIHGHDQELLFPVVDILSTTISKNKLHL